MTARRNPSRTSLLRTNLKSKPMASIKVKFRPSTIEGKEGTVYYQIIQNRVIRQLKTDYRIFTDEWNEAGSCIIVGSSERSNQLLSLQERIEWDLKRLDMIIRQLNNRKAGYTADDNYDGDLTGKVKTDGEVDVKKTGDYVLTYTVEDSSGNKAEEKRTIHVVDTTAPIITLAGENTVYVQNGENYTEAGYMAQDGCDGDITDRVTVSGDVDTSTAGSYILTYEVKDSSGNEASMQRTVRVYAPVQVNTVDPGNKVVYLTFDDGPGPYTAQLLDVLDKYNVKATFFVTNTRPDYRTMIAEEAKRGHTVAIHSASHVYSQIYQSEDAYFADLEEMNQIIIEQTGQGAQIIRFPGGSSNTVSAKYSRGIMSRLVKDVEARGFLYCDWNVSSGDAGSRPISTQQVVQNVTEGMQKNNVSIVLQHDIKEFSVNAVEQIIQWGLAEGYTFLPLSTSSPMSHHGVNN